jgi:hypothetical protein
VIHEDKTLFKIKNMHFAAMLRVSGKNTADACFVINIWFAACRKV